MIVSITGFTGNMGLAVLKELCTLPEITSIKLLVRSNKKVIKLQKLLNKIKGNIKVEYILGDMNSSKAIEELTNNTNYVINMAAVIPPHSRSYYVGDVDRESIKAKLDNGVLSIIVPKAKAEEQKKAIAIE